jgi:hypothetical protein
MSYEWHGRENDETGKPNELIWKNEIVRYYFRSNQQVMENLGTRNEYVAINVGHYLRLNKTEAKRVVKQGYYEYTSSGYDAATNTRTTHTHKISGELIKEVEKREARQYALDPSELVPPKQPRKKKQ